MVIGLGKNEIALAIILSAVLACPAQANLSDAAMSSKLTAAKVLPKGVAVRLVRNEGNNLRIELTHYPTLDEKTQKIDALLVARTVMHADPGGVNSVVSRFINDSEPYTYHDVLVSNRDIVGADAGILGTDELLAGIGIVTIRANDSVEQRCAKYIQAADQSLKKEDFHESENLFAQAYRESPDVARNDGKYFSGLVQLAHSYSGREDSDDEDRVYRTIITALPSGADPDALHAVRDTFNHYFMKNDYPHAEKVATALIDAEAKANKTQSEEYASDLQLLASCHRRQGRSADAKKEYEEVLLLKRNLLGESHPALAEVYEGLGDCYNDEKNEKMAHDFWKQAKVAYDHAAVTKDTKHRMSYEVYRSVIARINGKLAKPERRF